LHSASSSKRAWREPDEDSGSTIERGFAADPLQVQQTGIRGFNF
jgi:hypothetical protein